jgi:septum formation protein
MGRIILASQSPRRRELLGQMGITQFDILPAQGEEDMTEQVTPAALVEHLALAKAKEVAAKAEPDAVVIAADTIVVQGGRVLGKPHSREEAFAMLSALSGTTHQVYTGVAVIRGGQVLVRHECTHVTFRPLSEEEIWAYIATGESMDKAGAYGIQGRGALLVEGIRGDYFNVVGLPVCTLGRMLREFGIKTL